MVDRVYKADIPRLKRELEALRDQFSRLRTETDWVQLRIEPLISHAKMLDSLMHSEEHPKEYARLRRGVSMFHSDLVYLRANVKDLKKLLQTEKKRAQASATPLRLLPISQPQKEARTRGAT